jgi:hypothetical protein
MKVDISTLSIEAQAHVQNVQDFILAAGGKPATPTAVVDGIVRCHADVTDLVGIDASLFGAALQSLVDQGHGHVLALWIKTLGDVSGYWTTEAPAPADASLPPFADSHRRKPAVVDGQERKPSRK